MCFAFACKSKKAKEAGGADPARTTTSKETSEPSGWDDVERAMMALGIQGLVLKLDLGGADAMRDRKGGLRITTAKGTREAKEITLTRTDDGVLIEPGAPFFEDGREPIRFFRMAYSSIPIGKIQEGVKRLAKRLRARA